MFLDEADKAARELGIETAKLPENHPAFLKTRKVDEIRIEDEVPLKNKDRKINLNLDGTLTEKILALHKQGLLNKEIAEVVDKRVQTVVGRLTQFGKVANREYQYYTGGGQSRRYYRSLASFAKKHGIPETSARRSLENKGYIQAGNLKLKLDDEPVRVVDMRPGDYIENNKSEMVRQSRWYSSQGVDNDR